MKSIDSPQRRRLLQTMGAGLPAVIASPLTLAETVTGLSASEARFVLYHRTAESESYRRWTGSGSVTSAGLLEVQLRPLGFVEQGGIGDWSLDAMLATPDAAPSAFTAWRYLSQGPELGSRSARFVVSARQWRGAHVRYRERDAEAERVQYLPLVQEGSADLALGDYLLLRLPSDRHTESLQVEALPALGISAGLAFSVRAWAEPAAEIQRADLAAIRAAHEPVELLA